MYSSYIFLYIHKTELIQDEIGVTCGMHYSDKKCVHNFRKSDRENTALEISHSQMITAKWILKEMGWEVWRDSAGLGYGQVEDCCEHD